MLLLCGLLGALVGRLCFRRWFNHITLYSIIWGMGLALYEIGLIRYPRLAIAVWLMVLTAWVAFLIGSVLPALANRAVAVGQTGDCSPRSWSAHNQETRLLAIAILILTVLALFAVINHWVVLINRFGSITNVLLNGYQVYRLRTTGHAASIGVIPYVDSFALAACCLGGIYAARKGRMTLLALLPLLTLVMEDIAQAGRAKMLIGSLLFFSAFFLTKRRMPAGGAAPAARARFRSVILLVFLGIILVGAFEFVRFYRGANEVFYGMSRQLGEFTGTGFITPSVYLYLSSHVGVFNAYWNAGGESFFPGANTFAPLFRVLAKFELADAVPFFQKFYNVPVSTNTGTYLRELHADFGLAGVLLAPFLIGWLCTFFMTRTKRQPRLVNLIVLTHLYLIVMFSFFYQITRLGEWLISLLTALAVAMLVDLNRYLHRILRVGHT
ncbi:MAG: oligosaccharide repeat unit polymerase [candidate division KSB1 bacterium]|nr:oligosaccharide repeat unit polymerase [candidate division KSB1 bacterium]MDZ7411308.1 oligosaccharide repeat unit polymerase [candidate division KSB1 bacterium]